MIYYKIKFIQISVYGSHLVHGEWHAVLHSLSAVHPSLMEKHVGRNYLVVLGHGRDDVCHRLLRPWLPPTSHSTFSVRLFFQITNLTLNFIVNLPIFSKLFVIQMLNSHVLNQTGDFCTNQNTTSVFGFV